MLTKEQIEKVNNRTYVNLENEQQNAEIRQIFAQAILAIDLQAEVERLKAQDEWISCYQAPKNPNEVLVTNGKDIIISRAIYDRDTDDWFFPCGITHWRPLPKTPKEAE